MISISFSIQFQLDSKSCPLALLAKTCSQIGADSSDIGAVVGNGNANLHSNSVSSTNNKGGINQHRDSILNVSTLYERSNNKEGSKSRGNASPSDLICPSSLSRSSKSPSIGLLLPHDNIDKQRSDGLNGALIEGKTSAGSRSSSVEINVTHEAPSSLISPTKDTSSLSSLSSLSSASSFSRKSQSISSDNENNLVRHNIEHSNLSKNEETEKRMPPLIENTPNSGKSDRSDNKSSDQLSKPKSISSNLENEASKHFSQTEKSTANTSQSSSTVKNGLESLMGLPRDIPLGTYPRGNRPVEHSSNISESLQNYLMYQSLSNYSQTSANASTLLSPHLALALAAGATGRNPFMPNNLSPSLAGSLPGGTRCIPPSGVCRDPLCRDPLCPTSMRNQQLLAAATGTLPASSFLSHYSSLFSTHSRENMLSAAQRQAIQASMLAAAATQPPGSAGGSLPYICNWVSGKPCLFLTVFITRRIIR